MASELTAARREVSMVSYRVDVLERKMGDLQDRMNRVEILLQRLANPQARVVEPRNVQDWAQSGKLETAVTRRIEEMRQSNLESIQGIQLMRTSEGNLKFPSTGPSVVVTGWDLDPLPHAFSASPTLNNMNPSHGPEMAKDMERRVTVVAEKHAQNASVGQNMNLTTAARGKLLNEAIEHKKETPHEPFPPGVCKYCRGKWFWGHKCKQSQQVNLMSGDVSDEAQFDLAQLYVVGRADKRLRCTGLFWNLPPWPDLSFGEVYWMAMGMEKGAGAVSRRNVYNIVAGQSKNQFLPTRNKLLTNDTVLKKETALKPFIPVNFNLYWSLIVICYLGEVETFEDGAPESVCAIWGTQQLSTSNCLNDSEEKLGMASGCILETGSVPMVAAPHLPKLGVCPPDKVNGAVEFCGVRWGQARNLLGTITYDPESCAWMFRVDVMAAKLLYAEDSLPSMAVSEEAVPCLRCAKPVHIGFF